MVMWVSPVVVFGGGFLVGVVTLLVLEALGLYVLFKRLNQRTKKEEAEALSLLASDGSSMDSQLSFDNDNKKGVVWILEADRVPKNWQIEKVSKEQKKKKEFVEVNPVKKYARIKDRSLILTDLDGSQTVIPLKGCTVEAVSATSRPSRKWAKRFPIKLKNTTSASSSANKIVYIYLETSWDKESWCKALRQASCDDEQRLNWVTKLNEEFHLYLTSLNTGYPSFMKPSMMFSTGSIEIDKTNRVDGSGSRVRLFLKKLAKKASKTGVENRVPSMLSHEDRKINGKCGALVKTATTANASVSSAETNFALPSTSTLSPSASQIHSSVVYDIESDDKFNIDEGTLCWNLLISRLFFDAKNNSDIKNSAKERIQRTLSNMRIPSYIGEVICTDLHLGNLPPYIHNIRVLPMDMNEVWAWEVDIEYFDGVVLDIETRLEVHDLDLPKGTVDANTGSSSTSNAPVEHMEGFEYFGEQLNLRDRSGDVQGQKDMGYPTLDQPKFSTSGLPTNVSRWKSIVNSVAKQVSQVPISLSIKVASLHGTVRIHIKPPPSDQLWYGFTSMPDVEFCLESSVGEHKITSGHIASYLINRFKTAIHESMVLPNCESVTVPWMLGEKNDWVRCNVAPFMWHNQESTTDRATALKAFSVEPNDRKAKIEAGKGTSSDHLESNHQMSGNEEYTHQPISDSSDASLSSSNTTLQSNNFVDELKTPLLGSSEPLDSGQESRGLVSESRSPSRSLIPVQRQNHATEDDDSKPKKMGRRAKMLDLGKKMGEKLEEKRRNIEEKGRNIVEKMRGP